MFSLISANVASRMVEVAITAKSAIKTQYSRGVFYSLFDIHDYTQEPIHDELGRKNVEAYKNKDLIKNQDNGLLIESKTENLDDKGDVDSKKTQNTDSIHSIQSGFALFNLGRNGR